MDIKKEKKYTLVNIEPSEVKQLPITAFIKTPFNYTIQSNLYLPQDSTLVIYNVYKQFIIDKVNKLNTPIITISPDPAISGATISGICEKFMFTESKQNNISFNTDVKIIYIDSLPDLSKKPYTHYNDFNNSIISDCLSLNTDSFSNCRVAIKPNNICYIGLNKDIIPDEQEHILNELPFECYSIQTLRQKGIKKIMTSIVDDYKHDNIHIVIDLSCLALKYTPCAIRQNEIKSNDGFNIDELGLVISSLKELNINSIDITGYNFGTIENKEQHNVANKITINSIEIILSHFIDNYKKSLNIFDEESKFLIWKKLDDVDPIGWLILRNMTNDVKQNIINAIGDRIINIPVSDENETYEALVTTTTIKEQQERSFYMSNNVTDCCLYPGEKINMLFELINNE
jgi:arginase family enzyme